MKKENIDIIINAGKLFALLVTILVLIVTIMVLVKNKEIIQKDPITYVMSNMNFTSCDCILNVTAICECSDSEGKVWNSAGHGRFARKTIINVKYLENVNLTEE